MKVAAKTKGKTLKNTDVRKSNPKSADSMKSKQTQKLAAVAISTVIGQKIIRVPAQGRIGVSTELQPWIPTGIHIEPSGQQVEVKLHSAGPGKPYPFQWRNAPNDDWCRGEGHVQSIADNGFVLPGYPYMCLVGRIGEGENAPFYLGNGGLCPLQRGQLFLACNDIPGAYADNDGELDLEINYWY